MTKKQLAIIEQFKQKLVACGWVLDYKGDYFKSITYNEKTFKVRIKFNKISYRVDYYTSSKDWVKLNSDTKYLKDLPIEGQVTIGNKKITIDVIEL
ncbi:MAG: hypothetical protein WC679_00835 [Bacteroidales bacterium]|jgi:hypothetical protein